MQGANADHLAAIDFAGEFRNVIIRRAQNDVLPIARLHQTPIPQNGDGVANPHGLVQIMRDEHDGLVQLLLQFQQDGLHIRADQRVQRRKRFVHQQDIGIGGQRAGQPHTLLHPAG